LIIRSEILGSVSGRVDRANHTKRLSATAKLQVVGQSGRRGADVAQGVETNRYAASLSSQKMLKSPDRHMIRQSGKSIGLPAT
jgi:hypothetical protein